MNVQRNRKIVTSEDIIADLTGKIETLVYAPGELISEGDLCSAYSTTRHTVRGALAVLKEKGLVEVYPQRGTFVALIDLERINDILFLRVAVEQEVVRRIIEKGDNEKLIKKLRAEVEKQKKLENPLENAATFYKLDDGFHGLLLSAVGRPNLPELYGDQFIFVRRWRNLEVRSLERLSQLPEEHAAIIDAIEKEDPEAARKIISHHIDSVGRYGDELKKDYPAYFI